MDSQFRNIYETEIINEAYANAFYGWKDIARSILKAKYKLEHL